MLALDGEQFARHGADMFFVSRIHAVAPLASLRVEITPCAERASCQKVVFNEEKWPLDPSRAVGIAALMSDKVKAESFRERLHLRHRNHLAPGAAQHHDMRVVDHDLLGNASDITQRVRKEHFAIEALERGIKD